MRPPQATFPGVMPSCLYQYKILVAPHSLSIPLHPKQPVLAGHRSLDWTLGPGRLSSANDGFQIRRMAPSTSPSPLFLVTLCKFFATSGMWGVLASNCRVTAQRLQQAVPLVRKIKGFVISHNKRGLWGRPSENLTYPGLLSGSCSTFFPASASPYPQEM